MHTETNIDTRIVKVAFLRFTLRAKVASRMFKFSQ